MKRVLILQHMRSDGPAYLATWLRERGIAHEVRNAAIDDRFPSSIEGYDGLAVLGGAMSANDSLPFLRDAERLILQAMASSVPVIGHCLGGQLMARALGARVGASPAPEIGWQPMEVLPTSLAQDWLGPVSQHHVMHWHYEAFDLPAGAHALARSSACPHQAFSIGPHLAMQFHIEIDHPKLQRWLDEGDPSWHDALQSHKASVQDKPAILSAADRHMKAHQALADRIYGRWVAGGAPVASS